MRVASLRIRLRVEDLAWGRIRLRNSSVPIARTAYHTTSDNEADNSDAKKSTSSGSSTRDMLGVTVISADTVIAISVRRYAPTRIARISVERGRTFIRVNSGQNNPQDGESKEKAESRRSTNHNSRHRIVVGRRSIGRRYAGHLREPDERLKELENANVSY